MNLFARPGIPASHVKDLSQVPAEPRLFARIERLGGEEAALLAVAPEERPQQQHDRLRAIHTKPDRIWERLVQRASQLGDRRAAVSGS